MSPLNKRIQIIIGSTRSARVGDQVGEYVKQVVQENSPSFYEYEIVDLRDHPLPFFDEVAIPAYKTYAKDHTFKWSSKISEADAFIFVSPEYNGSIPAVLKNAIDFLYQEWKNKPTVIVSYANKGGSGAAANLRAITTRIGMKVAETMPALISTNDVRDPATNRIADTNKAFAPQKESIIQAAKELIELINSTAVTSAA
ncbi:hypothetical protein CYY_000113 [Polysphondylium violaceum]|uniref:NADPH-dependent FMN reductase-like domain-containing protein n=1 Tax=Polysphondylium violaceum TaxID=133409 RepID=A0A8J4V5Z9_9MYCE|nr:hypothetical protein CYY_000113 [Polysphondylium violaceum]